MTRFVAAAALWLLVAAAPAQSADTPAEAGRGAGPPERGPCRGWPQYRADAARTGYTAEELPARLDPEWTFQPAHPPEPSCPDEPRITYDRANQMVVAGGRLFFGSSADGSVQALEAATGRELWTFFTGAPVRCAPAVHKNVVLVGSDDGYLYGLAAADGRLLWKKRAGPAERWVIGNGHLISKWPVRGGPAVADGVVYFAAGVWPADGVYLYALDAETGRERWINSTAGTLKRINPHTYAPADTGIGFQGYLVVTGDAVLVPTGRGLAAAFDRATGEFRSFRTMAQGGTAVAAVDSYVFDGGYVFDAATGKEVARGINPLVMAAGSRWLVYATSTDIAFLDRSRPFVLATQPSSRPARPGPDVKQTVRHGKAAGTALIVAGSRVYSAGDKKVVAIDPAQESVVWSADVDGTPWGLAAAEGRLFVSTDTGTIHCFGALGGDRLVRRQPQAVPSRPSDPYALAAEEIAKSTGVSEGYCVDLSCGDGRLAYELAKRTRLFVYGVERDAALAAAARRRLADAGLYGARVTIHEVDPDRTRYPGWFANLVVSGRSVEEGVEVASAAETQRLARPWGGTVCLGKPGRMKKQVRGAQEGVGQWTHQYGSAAATTSSTDTLVGAPLTVRWFGGPSIPVPNRHGRPPAPLFFEGILYVMGTDALCALDAYNGRPLWQAPFPGIGKPYAGEHLLGTAGTGSTFCVAPEGVFVRHGGRCIRLDRHTGKPLGEYALPGEPVDGVWGFVACEDGVLIGSEAVTDHRVPYYYGKADMSDIHVESKNLFALEAPGGRAPSPSQGEGRGEGEATLARTGRGPSPFPLPGGERVRVERDPVPGGERVRVEPGVTAPYLWTYRARQSIRHNTIVMGGGRVFFVDRERAEEQPRNKPLKTPHAPGDLVCLEARTGREVWRRPGEAWGTVLSLSTAHDVLLMSGQGAFSGFGLTSDQLDRLAAWRASTGEFLWEGRFKYVHRPVLIDGAVYLNSAIVDLRTGDAAPWRLVRSHGCGMVVGSPNLLLFRSAVLGYVDRWEGPRTQHFGGIRPGCWVNAIPAGGMVLMPDFSVKCTCSYENKVTIALESGGPAVYEDD